LKILKILKVDEKFLRVKIYYSYFMIKKLTKPITEKSEKLNLYVKYHVVILLSMIYEKIRYKF